MRFLKSPYARVLTLLLIVQSGVFYAAAMRGEKLLLVHPLVEFPIIVQGWQTVQVNPVEQEVLDVLKADDTLNRVYVNPERTVAANLFVAFFKTQRTGQSPHSPKNCLPGSGWEPSETGVMTVDVPGSGHPAIQINRYVVARGDEKSVVLYWYQSHGRIIASEFSAKFWLVADSIRFGRSDTALVRVVVPVRNNDEAAAVNAGVKFVQALFPDLEKQLPA